MYIGHVISAKGIECDPSKIEVVRDWPIPTNKREIKSFLGFLGYYRKFLPDMARVAAPLTNLTRKRQKFVWDQACDTAFNEL